MSRNKPVDEHLARVPLFQGLSTKQLRDVSALMTAVEHPSGTVLTAQGDAGDEFFVIVDGAAEVRENGEMLATLGPGDVFGEMALFLNRPRNATVTTTTPVVVEVLDRAEFAALIHEFPEIGVQIMATMAHRLAELEERAAGALTTRPIRARRTGADVDKLVVTISATHGAGGGIIGPAVAERLGVPFLDRAIPIAVAEALDVPLSEAVARDWRREAGIGRLLASLAVVAVPEGLTQLTTDLAHSEHAFKEQTEIVIRNMAEQTGGVVLGRAAAIVLADHPSALHVRLDGDIESRVRQAVEYGEADEGTARKHLQQADKARAAYVQHFYKREPSDATLYHLVINSTKLSLETCNELIVMAAHSRVGHA